ncbi:flagellar hook-length control protein FliK [Kluyvera genomosp. 2]|uniref:flagellar hook-length control protein FliK n=1 Tax=Kluyvera genomosp. 2 TaxID=2774054 RepID=UPI002FD7DAAE
MITLPNLAVSDTNLAGADTAAKTSGGAEDFLALLAGALNPTANAVSGEKTALLTSDETSTPRELNAKGQSLTEWLVQQEATRTGVAADAATAEITQQSDAQSLLSSLAAHLKGELSVGKDKENDTAKTSDDDDTALSEEQLSSLNALMAMLPAPLQAPQTVERSAAAPAGDTLANLTTSLKHGGAKTDGPVEMKSAAAAQLQTDVRALPADSAFVLPAQKAEAESTPSPAAPTAALSPVAAPSSTTLAAPASVSANIHAQLGTPDWQQNVSQHITLFTRQGQQTAELRLHPESLGQVHITLKVEDNLAQIQMASPHGHVRAALEAALPVLRTQLADNGIQLGQSNISSDGFAGQQQQPSSQQSFASRADANGNDTQEDDALLAVPAALHAASRGDNAVDIFA